MEDKAMAQCSIVLLDLLLALLDCIDLLGCAHVVKKAGDEFGDSELVRKVYILDFIELAAVGGTLGHEDQVRSRVGAKAKSCIV